MAIVMAVVAHFLDKRRQRRLARTRRPMSRSEFLADLRAAGVTGATAEFVYEEIEPHYFDPLTPYPGDHVFSTMQIDPEDLADIAERFYERFSRPLPPSDAPLELPEDPTFREFALLLDRYAEAAAVQGSEIT